MNNEQQALPDNSTPTNRLARQEFESLEGYHKRQAFEKQAVKLHKYGKLIRIPKEQKWLKNPPIKKSLNADVSSESQKSSL
jgi:hypothetical protein